MLFRSSRWAQGWGGRSWHQNRRFSRLRPCLLALPGTSRLGRFWDKTCSGAHPDHHCSTKSGQQKFIKQQGSRLYHVVATYLSEQKAYLVISAWVRGEEDRPPLLWRLLTLPFTLMAKMFFPPKRKNHCH